MQGRFLLTAAVLISLSAMAIWLLDLSGWWLLAGLWIACVPVLMGLVSSDGSAGGLPDTKN